MLCNIPFAAPLSPLQKGLILQDRSFDQMQKLVWCKTGPYKAGPYKERYNVIKNVG